MNLLKKENWWMWLLLFVITGGSAFIFLGYLLGCFDKKAWYNKPKNWIMGLVILVLPFIVMMSIFTIEMTCKSAKKLDVSNSEIYLSPVILLLMLCIPIIGWVIFIATIIYLVVSIPHSGLNTVLSTLAFVPPYQVLRPFCASNF